MGNDRPSDSLDATDTDAGISLDVIPLHSTNLLTVLDADGVIQFESPSIERIYGFDQDELVGEQVAEYFHPADREAVVDAFRTVVEGEGSTIEAVEYRHRVADGSYRWVESVTSTNTTPDGHYVVNTRDISDRKAREERLKQTNERLDEFASVVSHDLRGPLNVASGRLRLAQDDCDSDHLTAVERALERMESLIDDLLTLARAGERVAEREWVDLETLATTCWRTVSTGDASLVTDIDRSIYADRSRLRQLLANLLGNAVDHGGEAITITIGEVDRASGFYVADDGTGIPADRRDRVFEGGYSSKQDGTGLGLTIVEDIATAHGWEIVLTESNRDGARFEIIDAELR